MDPSSQPEPQPQPQSQPAAFNAVDVVPQGAAAMGVLSLLATAALPLLGEGAQGNGLVLVAVLLLATLGVTLGLCGVILAVREGRRLALALGGTAASLALPLYMLAGMPWN